MHSHQQRGNSDGDTRGLGCFIPPSVSQRKGLDRKPETGAPVWGDILRGKCHYMLEVYKMWWCALIRWHQHGNILRKLNSDIFLKSLRICLCYDVHGHLGRLLLSFLFSVFAMLGVEPRVSHMLNKCLLFHWPHSQLIDIFITPETENGSTHWACASHERERGGRREAWHVLS